MALAVGSHLGPGRKEEAIQEVRHSLEQLRDSPRPVNLVISFHEWDLARVCTRVGETELALEQLQYLLSFPVPSGFSLGTLRYDPSLVPLRDHPRFQKLLAEAMKILPPPPS